MPQVGNYLGLTRRVCHLSPFLFFLLGVDMDVMTNLLGSRSFLVLILHFFIPHFTIFSLLLSCVFLFIVRCGLQERVPASILLYPGSLLSCFSCSLCLPLSL